MELKECESSSSPTNAFSSSATCRRLFRAVTKPRCSASLAASPFTAASAAGSSGTNSLRAPAGKGRARMCVLLVGVPRRLEPHRTLLAFACRHVAARELVGETLVGAGAKHIDV